MACDVPVACTLFMGGMAPVHACHQLLHLPRRMCHHCTEHLAAWGVPQGMGDATVRDVMEQCCVIVGCFASTSNALALLVPRIEDGCAEFSTRADAMLALSHVIRYGRAIIMSMYRGVHKHCFYCL